MLLASCSNTRPSSSKFAHSLIVQDDVRLPDLVEGQPDGGDVAEVGRVPRQVRVVPDVRDPAVGRQDLGTKNCQRCKQRLHIRRCPTDRPTGHTIRPAGKEGGVRRGFKSRESFII